MSVPFFRASIAEAEIDEVVDTMRSGWLTTGPKTRRFEAEFAEAVGARHAVAVNSCTAALHLGANALGLVEGQGVLVPAMTFAATAEIVRYQGGIPILVDCEAATLNIDLRDAEEKLRRWREGRLPARLGAPGPVVGLVPVHVGGLMADVGAIRRFAADHGLWLLEDAAHAFPSSWRPDASRPWQRCGERTADVTCFSFYATKTITTGEGGMAVTDDGDLASRMRMMSLHGLTHDAWERYTGGGSWDYKIVEAGYKYNLTDLASSIGIHQLRRAEEMRESRERIAGLYVERLSDLDEIDLPPIDLDRVHSWHLFPLRLRLERLRVDRAAFMRKMGEAGVHCSVHWRPLHLHPYYEARLGWHPSDCPTATAVWRRLLSLPIFPDMRDDEVEHVIATVRAVCMRNARRALAHGAKLAS